MNAVVSSGCRETRGHREEREAMRRGEASADRAPRDASEVAVEPALGNEFLHGATEPVASVAVAETLLEEGFEYRGRAVRVVPDKVLGVKPRPILFEDAVVGFEVAPHFRLRVRGHDGDLGDIEFEGSEGAKIFGDGFGRFGGQADDVVALRVEPGPIEPCGEFEGGLDFFVLVHLLENFLVETLDPEKGPLHAALAPLIEIAEEEIDAGLHEPADAVTGEEFDHRFCVRGEIAEIFVEHENETNSVLRVEAKDAIERVKGNGFGMRGKGGGLTKSAAEAASARGKENADRNRPPAGETEFGDERGMLDFVKGRAKVLRESFFAVAAENAIEGGLNGGREGT